MKLSNCEPTFNAIIETRSQVLVDVPNSDELRVLKRWSDMVAFIEENGDWACKLVDWGRRLTIPQFEQGRAKAMAAKARQCAEFGCE